MKKMVRIVSGKSMSFRREEREEEEEEVSSSSSNELDDFVVEKPKERLRSSRGSRFNLLANELRLESTRRKFKDLSQGLLIHPDNRWYKIWEHAILLCAIYSSFFTPMEFGFFRGLPENLFILDIAGQIAFLIDIVLQFFVAYRDSYTYRMVSHSPSIALRYIKSTFFIDLFACMPWDLIYKRFHRREAVRYLLWIRLCRVRQCIAFFYKLEKNIKIKYLFTRIIKLLAVEFWCTHTAACIFYYLATTLPENQEGYTWIGSLKLGDYSYSHFREIDIWKRYTTSLYFAVVTMATVGYGDIHAVNLREMIFVMIYVSFDMVLGAYLIGNMTALIVKGSKTERFRDKMTEIMKYMNRNRLDRDLREQIKGHLRLQYESSYTEASVLQDIPISLRAKISQSLYMSYIEAVPLFNGCSSEFINQIVTRVHEEFFLPGEVILEQGNVVDQLYFVCHGMLEEVGIGEDGSEQSMALLKSNSTFGQISIFCNIPQPYTVRVCELCRLLRIDKQALSNILDIYFYDSKRIYNNLLEHTIASLSREFAMKDLGKLHHFLGITVTRSRTGLFLSQGQYAKSILERASMTGCNATATPVDTSAKLSAEDGPKVADPALYRSLAGALQYLTITRPDISYAVQQICLFMHDPREPHLHFLKRLLRYIKGTLEFGLTFSVSSTHALTAYTDSDWAGCPTSRRSTSGYCVFLGDNLISWSSKRQATVSRSSAEAEYRGVAQVVAETTWLRNLLFELHMPLRDATLVYCDNISAVYLSGNPVHHQRTKHIEIDIHFVREQVRLGHVRVLHVPSPFQYADIFTKGLPRQLFVHFRSSLRVLPPPASTAGAY